MLELENSVDIDEDPDEAAVVDILVDITDLGVTLNGADRGTTIPGSQAIAGK